MAANGALLQRVRSATTQRPNASMMTVAAPTGGWNSRDSLAAMKPTDAVTLRNWFPGTTSVQLRYGHTRHATGLPDQVESLLVYNGASSSEMFAVSGTSVYDVTSAGAVGAAEFTGLTNARWQHINVATTAGKYLMAVNGADKAAFYTGSAWARDGDGAPYDITGVDSADCSQLNLHKARIWLIEDATLTAWYGAAGALGGAYTAFRLNGIARLGGYLVAMATWTIDAGYGVDDLAVFITSEGEIIVYRGTDPASTATWALVGVWEVGSPVGKRCFMKYAGDVLLVTQDGVVPLSGALQSSRVNPRVALTDKIQSAMTEAVSLYGANFGWELIHIPRLNQLYLNVPVQAGDLQQQYVMNSITKAWCNFTEWDANCWALLNDEPYFGGNTFVGQAWDSLADNGSAIQAFGLQAFSDCRSAFRKFFKMMRPRLFTNGTPSIYGNINTDFNLAQPTAPLSFSPTSYGTWGSGLWGSAIWGSSNNPQQNWQGANGTGVYGAPVLMASASGIEVEWTATDIVYERAKGIGL